MKTYQKFIFFYQKKKLKLITHREIEIWSELVRSRASRGRLWGFDFGSVNGEREIGFDFLSLQNVIWKSSLYLQVWLKNVIWFEFRFPTASFLYLGKSFSFSRPVHWLQTYSAICLTFRHFIAENSGTRFMFSTVLFLIVEYFNFFTLIEPDMKTKRRKE